MVTIEELKIKDPTIDLSNEDNLSKLLYEQDGLQQLLHISDEMLHEYYLAALEMLKHKRWQDASDAFVFLTSINGSIFNFWQALGIAEQSLGHFENAASAYAMAEFLEPNNPEPTANLYQCFVAVGAKKEGEIILKQAIEYCGDHPQYAELKQKLLRMSHQ